MESDAWKPDIVIGIDFGMTCTGVAYSSAPDWAVPRVLQLWPGRFANSELANKVPTQVSYDGGGQRRNWGFLCRNDAPVDVQGWFKLYLDPAFTDADPYPDAPSRAEAVRYFQDFMQSLYEHVQRFFEDSVPAWTSKKVEYLFSIPTTWRNPALSAELEEWLIQAGFGQDPNGIGQNRAKRRVRISQTEAEAAAVYAAHQHFKVNDVVLVCDAGGGTTDINILKVTARTREKTQLRALNKAEGINVGSALIDQKAERLVVEQLFAIPHIEDDEHVRETARQMMKNEFEVMKCAFGGDATDIDLLMTEPRTRQRIVITAEQLRELFEQQLQVMFAKVDDQMRSLQQEYPTEHIKYMVLSGGLGCSPYIRRRLRAKYSTAAPPSYNARNLEILHAEEPQLAVVKGLVMDRIQALSRGVGVYTGMCCRVSYGVVCRLPYDERKHRGEKVELDPIDGKKWAEGQIDWLVKQGEAVPVDGFSRPFRLKIPEGQEDELWQAQIVMSEEDAKDLPRSMRFDTVKKVCLVHSRFPNEDFQAGRGTGQDRLNIRPFRKKASFWKPKKDHYIAEFDIAVIVGSADLKFQLRSKDGRSFSRKHDEIHVTWEEAEATVRTTGTSGKFYPIPR